MKTFNSFYVEVLGCPKNVSDSEFIVREMEKTGLKFTDNPQDADLVVVNTCAFITPAILESVDVINEYIEYKDAKMLQKFISDQGKIIPRRVTGLSAKQHRELVRAIKRARQIAIMPFISEAVK